ncbi:YgfZ/GcvT domain-containing protein [Anaplasma phagocytophilum]|uniref:CAF17-like 4Fe-4S cluster assembly/insertion protein YgfZ n=1 Tax=Anaplasma phagocytophilum TaxID=948 RepID=UPI00200D702F|nr:folate-binding protein [Anaplasma phagocytophilum]UQD54300.1 folate-binding protein [Anaplasma phagocytophilum]
MFSSQSRGVIKVSGADAAKFLHNITTNDVLHMESPSAVYNLILNSKGRFLFDFFLIKCDKHFLLDCERGAIMPIIELLRLYRVVLKVKIKSCDEYSVALDTKQRLGDPGYTKTLKDGTIVFQDPRCVNMGVRYIVPNTSSLQYDIPTLQTNTEYSMLRMVNTIPNCATDMVSGESFPLHFGLDKLNAISHTKGCYTGQEVVARMHRIGTKKTLRTVFSESGISLPQTGEIFVNQQCVGEMIASTENWGLCMLETSKLPTGYVDLSIGDIKLTLQS